MGRQLSKFRLSILTSEEQVFTFFLTPRIEMSEKIDPQTPCTREFTTRRVLMSAGFPAILTRQHCGPSPLYTTTHLVPCPSSAQIDPSGNLLPKPNGWVPGQKEKGWHFSCQDAGNSISSPRRMLSSWSHLDPRPPQTPLLDFHLLPTPHTRLIFSFIFTTTTATPLHVPTMPYTSYPLPPMPQQKHEMHIQW